MKTQIDCIILALFALINVAAQNSTTHKSAVIPFQRTKEFCEFYKRSKYVVTIKNNSVLISFIHNQDTGRINGKIISEKLYINDPEEKTNKSLAGKYYLLTKDMIRILN